jgi:hypothetical protein
MNFDVTFCSNDDCDKRKNCQRSLSNLKINKKEWLSVSQFFPDEEGFCAYQIKIEDKGGNLDESQKV